MDKELLRIYMLGFCDELDSKPKLKYDDIFEQRAYDNGRFDAYYGDDVSSIDEQTHEQILNKIKNVKP